MNTYRKLWRGLQQMVLMAFFAWPILLPAQQPDPDAATPHDSASTNRPTAGQRRRQNTNDPMVRIREEGLNRSQVMQTLSYLTDVIGPRLTGSPNLKRANEWTRDKLTSWGMTNAHLEPWGPFGRGWSLKRFSAQVIEPQTIPLAGFPNAWSPGFEKPITAEVVYFDVRTNADFEKYKGKLKGAIVLASPVREVKARFDPIATRIAESNLLRLANAGPPRSFADGSNSFRPRFSTGSSSGGEFATGSSDDPISQTNRTRSGPDGNRGQNSDRFRTQGRNLAFLAKEGAALVITPSSQGDAGTLFVSAASVPRAEGQGTNNFTNAPRAWSTNAPAIPPQVTLATEDYNRLVRMIKQGEKLKMTIDLQVQFHDQDVMAYNTVAEIPGTDLKDEVVMIGAHMDSWHSGTGATDNGAGVAATMEAMRILQAAKLQPRRTVRIGLWTGEEQGLLGSKAYVTKHFGYYTNITNSAAVRSPRGQSEDSPGARSLSSRSRATRKLVRAREYDKLSTYFNLDNGTGKIRGVYMQGNEAVRPLFRRWLEPFYDLGAETLTLSNTGGTDHQSFDAIGLPGFQFIQDPIDYFSRTHHSNADVFDRIQADDMKQAATIMAAFLYKAATMDEKLPRKPIEENAPLQTAQSRD